MTRLKFMIFALVVLGLWSYHLTVVSPAMLARANESAAGTLGAAASGVAQKLEAQRSLTQAAALRSTASPVLWAAAPKSGAKLDAPTVERVNALRAAAAEGLADAAKASLVVAMSNESGALWALGSKEPSAPEGVDVAAMNAAGGAGAVVAVGGVPYLMFAVPMSTVDKTDVKAAGVAIVGLPVFPEEKQVVDALVKDTGLDGVGVVVGGALKMSAGNKTALEKAMKLKNQELKPITEGSVSSLGPLSLPMFVGSAVSAYGSRREIAPGVEVVAVVSTAKAVEALAGYQKFAFLGLLGLALLAVVVAVLLGSGEDEAPRMVVPPPMPAPPPAAARPAEPEKKALIEPTPAPAPEASPDDFHFPQSAPAPAKAAEPAPAPVQPAPAPVPAPPPPAPVNVAPPAPQPKPQPPPVADPFAMAAPATTSSSSAVVPLPGAAPSGGPAVVPLPSSKPPPPFGDEEEDARTTAYPAYKPPIDPFAAAAAQHSTYDEDSEPDSSDSTRVAAVPAELIKAARTGGGQTSAPAPAKAPSQPPKVAGAPTGGASDEERHFQDVFKEFVATREKCGEPADGLTFEKFKAKLLKNKEQLVQKYACKSVRFQVYVKDGKAALKATPVKE